MQKSLKYSDIGGSIRIPAHFCGVYGHKASYGAIPLRGHIPPPPGSLSAPDMAAPGPIARSAEDLGLLLGVLADAYGPVVAGWKPVLPAPRARRLQDFRVVLWLDDPALPSTTRSARRSTGPCKHCERRE
jgi:amidase